MVLEKVWRTERWEKGTERMMTEGADGCYLKI